MVILTFLCLHKLTLERSGQLFSVSKQADLVRYIGAFTYDIKSVTRDWEVVNSHHIDFLLNHLILLDKCQAIFLEWSYPIRSAKLNRSELVLCWLFWNAWRIGSKISFVACSFTWRCYWCWGHLNENRLLLRFYQSWRQNRKQLKADINSILTQLGFAWQVS